MTAFAGSEVKMEALTIHCELRSVNHRYLDITLRLPERFRFAEAEIRAVISKKVKRGKVECSLRYKKSGINIQLVDINLETVKSLLESTNRIEQLMQAPRNFSALEVLNFPGVQQELETDTEQLKQSLVDLLDEAVNKMLEKFPP